MPDSPLNRKPLDPRRPPVIVPPPPGAVLGYQQPRRQKSFPRRIINHVRYHYEDRLGSVLMWVVGPIAIAVLILMLRPGFWILVMRQIFRR